MNIVYVLFAVIVAPVLFFMLTWALVTVYRLLFPDEPAPSEQDPVVDRQHATSRGEYVPVGAREIREDRRYYLRAHPPASYLYVYGESEGLPELWTEDLWRRRN